MRNNLSIVVIAYKNAGTLQEMINELQQFLATFFNELTYEIVIISCYSPSQRDDSTIKVADALSMSDCRIKNYGFPYLKMGEALHKGIKCAQYDWMLWLPGDGETETQSLQPLIWSWQNRDEDFFVTFSSNYHIRPILRRATSLIFKTFCNWFFGLHLQYHNGVSIYRKDDLGRLDLNSKGYAFNLEIISKLINAGKKYIELPIILKPQTRGLAFKWHNVIPTIKEILRIKSDLL